MNVEELKVVRDRMRDLGVPDDEWYFAFLPRFYRVKRWIVNNLDNLCGFLHRLPYYTELEDKLTGDSCQLGRLSYYLDLKWGTNCWTGEDVTVNTEFQA